MGRALLLSPLFGLLLRTMEALDDGYYLRLLSDPGHRRIRIYDQCIVHTAFIVGLFIVFYENDLWGSATSTLGIVRAIFLPQLTSWTSLFVLYGLSALLFLYDKKRGTIIRAINEKRGAW